MRKYLIFAVIGLPLFLSHVGSTAIAVAFPRVVSHFGTSLVLAGWVLSVYQLVNIASIPVTAKLSDTVGRRSTFTLSLVLFTIGSFLCAIAPNMGWLIFFRAIQAVGGGGFMATAIGIVTDEFPDARQRMIGLFTSVATFGSIAGPNIGGVMVEYLGWQSVFWFNVPIGLLALVLVRYFIKADIKKTGRSELDFLGIGLLTGFVSAMMIALTLMSKAYQVPTILIALIALLGLLLLITFVLWTKNHRGAVFSLQMLAGRPFLAANLFNIAFGACAEGGIMSLLPLYATSVYGMSVLESGLMITPRSLGVVLASIPASFFLVKWGYRRPMVAGTLVTLVGFAFLGIEPGGIRLLGISLTPFVLIMLIGLLIGMGAGLVNPAANNACIDLMPEKAASITGLRQISRRIGQTIGIAVSTLVLESSVSMARGFTLLFMGFGVLLLLAIVAAFSMPASPIAVNRQGKWDTP